MVTKKTKAQITIFLIIGLVLLLIFSIFFYAISQYRGTGIFGDPFKPIENYVQECLEQVTGDGINLLSLQGGYIYLEGDYLMTPYQQIAYQLPSDQVMEEELGRFVQQSITACTDFAQFSNYQITIDGNASATTNIFDQSVTITLTLPLTISKGSEVRKLDTFQYIAPVRMGHVVGIMRMLAATDDWLDLTQASTYDVTVNLLTYNGAFVFNVEDPESMLNGKFYNFLSAKKK